MYDIDFYKNSFPLKKNITQGKLSLLEVENIEKELERLRKKAPTIFNIETTNYCNMKCVFCARTIYMERKNIWINDDLFEKMLDQVATHAMPFWTLMACHPTSALTGHHCLQPI